MRIRTLSGRPGGVKRTLEPRGAPEPAHAMLALYARLEPADIQEVRDRLTPEELAELDVASDLDRMRLILSFGLRDGTGRVAERTGLRAAVPPADVHSMTRNDTRQIGGAYYYADLVLDWLTELGFEPPSNARILDFSCSSGRVSRVLAAVRPDVRWTGCDPNQGAIAWASEHLPGVEFFVSPLDPPLPYEGGQLTAAFALSVWSHYSAAAALRWLEEMHRLIQPGGLLLFSTHGLNSCQWFERVPQPIIVARLGRDWVRKTAGTLERDGHCFWNVFGPDGDHGVHDSDWGLAFFTPEWLLEHATPQWSVLKYRLGRAEGNQDVYVLRREAR